MNQAANSLPPVLPHILVKLRGREFAVIVIEQKMRLSERWTDVQIDAIELDFQALKLAYEGEDPLKDSLDACNWSTTFESGWALLRNRFPSLESFCGGIATAFPGTSTVESDFSVVKWEKDPTRLSLSDFSLEGILHSKQYHKLNSLREA